MGFDFWQSPLIGFPCFQDAGGSNHPGTTYIFSKESQPRPFFPTVTSAGGVDPSHVFLETGKIVKVNHLPSSLPAQWSWISWGKLGNTCKGIFGTPLMKHRRKSWKSWPNTTACSSSLVFCRSQNQWMPAAKSSSRHMAKLPWPAEAADSSRWRLVHGTFEAAGYH